MRSSLCLSIYFDVDKDFQHIVHSNSAEEEMSNSDEKMDAALAALDNWYDQALQSGMGFKSDDERQSYLKSLGDPEKHPMFATNTEDLEGHPYVEALRAIREEDKTNYELAMMYKDEGNEWMKKTDKKSLKEAFERYTHALDYIEKAEKESSDKYSPADVQKLKSQILGNRAQTSLTFGNYGSAKRDGFRSIAIWPENIKAHYRLCKAMYLLKQYELCQKACAAALVIEPTAKDIDTLKSKCEADWEALRAGKERALAATWNDLSTLWKSVWDLSNSGDLKVALGYSPSNVTEPPQLVGSWPKLTMEASDENPQVKVPVICWPTVLLYPQYNKFDIIPDANVDAMLAEYLISIFPERDEEDPQYRPAEWDTTGEYVASNLVVYLQYEGTNNTVNERCNTLAQWQLACLEYYASVQSGTVDSINYGLRQISSTAGATTAAGAAATSNAPQVESVEQFLQTRVNRENRIAAAKKTQVPVSSPTDGATRTPGVFEVHLGCTLRRILSSSIENGRVRHILPRGVLSLIIFPRGSKPHKKFLKSLQEEGLSVEPLNP